MHNSFALYAYTGRWYQYVSGDIGAWNICGTMVILPLGIIALMLYDARHRSHTDYIT